MIKNKKYLQVLVVAALLFGVFSIIKAPHALAATKTWTGGGSDDNWSTSANWSPSGAPIDGDAVVFTNGGTTLSSTNDITGLELASISMNGTGTESVYISLDEDTTINGDITSTIATNSGSALLGSGDLTLGADVTVTNVGLAGGGDVILNSHALTMVTNSAYTDSVIAIDKRITGSGTFNIDIRNSISLFLADSGDVPSGNNYSGTTNLITGLVTTSSGVTASAMFGTSTINIGPTATLSLYAGTGGSFTFTNAINLAAATVGQSGFLSAQVYVWAGASSQTINIPNITLAGNARFDLNDLGFSNVVVNLAGIQSNSFCIQYGDNNSAANNFQNGPTACVIGTETNLPGVPNTGTDRKNSVYIALAGAAGVLLVGFGIRRGLIAVRSRN